jgi:hypothetical protein
MIDLFRNFIVSLGGTKEVVDKHKIVYHNDFELYDSRACVDCLSKNVSRIGCDQVVMSITLKNNDLVTVFSWEQILREINYTIGKRCDYILSGENKIIFCELTCSESYWMNPYTNGRGKQAGKRAIAISQIFDTICLMTKHDVLWTNILTKYEKYGVIGWRENDDSSNMIKNKASRNMQIFMKTPSSTSSQITSEQTVAGVKFQIRTVKYPTKYIW